MTSYHARPEPDETDIRNAYRLALAREAESRSVVDEQLAHAGKDWLTNFFRSGEFQNELRPRLLEPRFAPIERLALAPTSEMVGWVTDRLPISEETKRLAAAARNGYDLLRALHEDHGFQCEVLREDQPDRILINALKAASERLARGIILGEVESVTPVEVRGWAADQQNPDRILSIQLLIDGQFVAAAGTTLFRREIQDRLGGRGERGFVIRYRVPAEVRPGAWAEIREQTSETVLGTFRIPQHRRPAVDAVAEIRRELDSLRALLNQIEGKLPAFQMEMGFSLDSYAEYWEAFYGPLEREGEGKSQSADLTLVVDAMGIPASQLDLVLHSVSRQGCVPLSIAVAYDGGEAALEAEDIIRKLRARIPALSLQLRTGKRDERANLLNEIIAQCHTEFLMLVRADGVLSPLAAGSVRQGLGPETAFVYADDDRIEWTAGGRARHLQPRFRSAFDRDVLLQTGSLGGVLGLRTEAARRVGFRSDFGDELWFDFLLRLSEMISDRQVRHLPHVLFHRTGRLDSEFDPEMRLAAAADHLARVEPTARVVPHMDVLGARVEGAVQVIRAVPDSVRAAIIIPTKDRLDLLGPCIASIAASQTRSHVKLDVTVVDNRSTAAATRAFLASYARLAEIRVLEHDAPFNWALINNRAAELASDADVLVFLNNDTVVLAPDCWDSLCANALRPGVGAVGARLLYEDGTIQHAGVVMDQWYNFASHEGVGLPGSDPGYLGRHALVREVSTVTGACLATRSEVFRECGGFDALNFPYEGNDTDYCLRLRANGLKILYDPGATLYHFESKSRGFNTDEEKRNRAWLATRTLRDRWSRFEIDPFYNLHFDRLATPFSRLQPLAVRPKSY